MLLVLKNKLLNKYMQDKEDDLKVGVKSTALRFGDSTKGWLTGFSSACITSLAVSGFNADLGTTLNFLPKIFMLFCIFLLQLFIF